MDNFFYYGKIKLKIETKHQPTRMIEMRERDEVETKKGTELYVYHPIIFSYCRAYSECQR